MVWTHWAKDRGKEMMSSRLEVEGWNFGEEVVPQNGIDCCCEENNHLFQSKMMSDLDLTSLTFSFPSKYLSDLQFHIVDYYHSIHNQHPGAHQSLHDVLQAAQAPKEPNNLECPNNSGPSYDAYNAVRCVSLHSQRKSQQASTTFKAIAMSCGKIKTHRYLSTPSPGTPFEQNHKDWADHHCDVKHLEVIREECTRFDCVRQVSACANLRSHSQMMDQV